MFSHTRLSALVVFVLLALAIVAAPAFSETARRLNSRIVIDGFTNDFTEDERIFGLNSNGEEEESTFDSQWGPDNDINQIRITWDQDTLYVAGEGVIWGNNMIILFDVVPNRGMANMQNLNSWRRNFVFSQDFRPDLFLATWDGNTNPRLLIHQGGDQIDDQQVGELFRASATFSQNLRGRSMEFAIPWNTFFLGSEGLGTTSTFSPALGETLQTFPVEWGTIEIAGVITAGADGTGGPDSAPDNTQGHVSDGSQVVVVDNFARLSLDEQDDSGLGGGGPDGVADWGVEPRSRVSFKIEPPIDEVRLELTDVELDRPAIAPDLGHEVKFTFDLSPVLDPSDPVNVSRRVTLSANVYDVRGRKVRDLYVNQERDLVQGGRVDPSDPLVDRWDGRDENGDLVPGGIYLLRVVLEPDASRIMKSVVVVR